MNSVFWCISQTVSLQLLDVLTFVLLLSLSPFVPKSVPNIPTHSKLLLSCPPQRCLRSHPSAPSSSSSPRPSRLLRSSPDPQHRPGTTSQAPSRGPPPQSPGLLLRRPRPAAVAPSQRRASGPPIRSAASPTRCCHRR